jgi:hypothetical protein
VLSDYNAKENDDDDLSDYNADYNDEDDDKDDNEDDAEDDEGLPSRPKRPRLTPKHSLTSYGYTLTDATIKRLLRGAELLTDTLKKQLLRQVRKVITTRSAVYTSPLLSLYNLYIHELYRRLGLYYNILYKELLRRLYDLYINLSMWDEMKGRNKGWFKHIASNLESRWRFPMAGSSKPRIVNLSLIQSLTFA